MNPTGKKFISLFLVFFLLEISCTTITFPTKEKRFKEHGTKQGAKLLIIKKDGTQFPGNLIAVKQNSLLILVPSGRDESVDIEDIKIIQVMEKFKIKQLLIVGAIGGTVSYLIFLLCLYPIFGGYGGESFTLSEYYKNALPSIYWVPLVSVAGLAILKPKYFRKFKIEGMTDSEIQETLDYLRKKARIRDYK